MLVTAHRSALAGALVLAMLGASQTAVAYELYADEDSHLNADLLAVWGMFNSRKNYDGTPGGSTWREGFIKYGVSGDQGLAGNGSLYGALNWVSSGMRAATRTVPNAPPRSKMPTWAGAQATCSRCWVKMAWIFPADDR